MADFRDSKVSLAGQGTLVGVAASTVSSGACQVDVSGIRVAVRVVTGLTIAQGNWLLIIRRGSTYWAIAVIQPGPAVPPASGSPVEDGPSTGDPSPTPKTPATTGQLVCTPVSTATYRDGVWRADLGPVDSTDTYQGRYSGSSFGLNTGCAFYGGKPRTLSGATVTRATVRVRRLESGDFAARTATLRLVSQSTRGPGAPTLNESTTGPSLGVYGKVGPWETTFTIPTSWAQAMVDGTRGGLAISISSDSPYIRLAGRGSQSSAWTLIIDWRRG